MMRRIAFVGIGALVVASIAYALVYWFGSGSGLTFRDRASPEGFRELVVGSSMSRLDPLSVLQPASNAASSVKGLKRSAREVCDALFRNLSAPAAGSPNDVVQIAAFFDYRCPYCRTLSGILSELQDRGDIRVVYQEWPVFGGPSELAARAALAANRQGRYLAFHRRLMPSRFIPTLPLIEAIAAELGVDRARLLADMESTQVADAIRDNMALAAELGLAGTPVLVVGRTVIEGEVSRGQLERVIRQVAGEGASAAC